MKGTKLLAGLALVSPAGWSSEHRADPTKAPAPSRVAELPLAPLPSALPLPFAQGSGTKNEHLRQGALMTRMPHAAPQGHAKTFNIGPLSISLRDKETIPELGPALKKSFKRLSAPAAAMGAVAPPYVSFITGFINGEPILDDIRGRSNVGLAAGVALGVLFSALKPGEKYTENALPNTIASGVTSGATALGIAALQAGLRYRNKTVLQAEIDRKFKNPQSQADLGVFLEKYPNVKTAEFLYDEGNNQALIYFQKQSPKQPPACFECELPDEAFRRLGVGSIARKHGTADYPFDFKIQDFSKEIVGFGTSEERSKFNPRTINYQGNKRNRLIERVTRGFGRG